MEEQERRPTKRKKEKEGPQPPSPKDIFWPDYIYRWPDSDYDACQQAAEVIESLSLALEQESMERRRLQVELHSLILNMDKTSPVPRYIKERLKREKE